MKKGKLAAIVLLAAWGIGGAVVIACGDDDNAVATNTDAGVDAHPTATVTATATATSTSTPDTGAPIDSGDLDAGVHGLWGFNAYCPDDAGDDAGCNVYDKCPTFEGGLAAQDCDPPSARCVAHAPVDSGIHDRLFLCESTATSVWELNRVCAIESCADVTTGCSNDAGVGGLPCTTPAAQCIADNGRVFVCEPNGGLAEIFNGYCDAGSGISACPVDASSCVVSGGGAIGATSCTSNLARCVSPLPNDAGAKIFVCGDRSP